MKKTIQILCILLLSTMTMTSCSMFKSEDKKISEALTGSFEQDEMTLYEVKVEKVKWDFDKNGEVSYSANSERTGNLKFTGKWEIKDKALTIKLDNVKSDDEKFSDKEKDDIIENINKQFKSCEITSYDDKKIVFKDKEGEKQTLTKSKD